MFQSVDFKPLACVSLFVGENNYYSVKDKTRQISPVLSGFQASACVFSGPSTETNSVKMTNPINSVYGFQASKPTPRQEGAGERRGKKGGGGGGEKQKKRQKHVQYEK